MDATTIHSGHPGHRLILMLNCSSSSIEFAVINPTATPLSRTPLRHTLSCLDRGKAR